MLSRPSLWSLVSAPVRSRTYRNLTYVALSFPLGMGYFLALVTGLSLSVPLTVALVGVPPFLLTLLLARGLAAIERELAGSVLGLTVPSPTYRFLDGSVRERVAGLLLDRETWLECLYLLLKFPLGLCSSVFLLTTLTVSLTLLATPLYYDQPGARVGVFPAAPITLTQSLSVPWADLLVGVDVATTVSEWAVDSLGDALVFSAIGLVALVGTLNLVNALAWLSGWVAQWFLGDRTATRDALGRVTDAIR